jgi:hypothetical protein
MRIIILATLILGLLGLLGLTGCTPPPVLIAQGFSGDRVIRYTIQNVGAGNDDTGNLYDLSVKLCNQADDASDQNCKDTVVLQNVYPGSVY